MELLTEAKEKHLLEAGLEILHRESITWLNTICFWEDESYFFKELINTKLFQYIDDKDKAAVTGLVEGIIGYKLMSLKSDIALHEKDLNTLVLLKADSGNYRKKHKELLHEFNEFDKQMKVFKTSMFGFVELLNKNFFNANETLHTIYERRAIRKYKPQTINKIHIEQIISAGRMAPSAMNKQPWKFYVVTNKAKIKYYSESILKNSNHKLYVTKTKSDTNDDPVFHGAPVVIFITAMRKDIWSCLDVGMCAQNIMLAAKSLGYDTCPVGMSKNIEKIDALRELGIPQSEELKIAILLGYAGEKPTIHKRKNSNIVYVN